MWHLYIKAQSSRFHSFLFIIFIFIFSFFLTFFIFITKSWCDGPVAKSYIPIATTPISLSNLSIKVYWRIKKLYIARTGLLVRFRRAEALFYYMYTQILHAFSTMQRENFPKEKRKIPNNSLYYWNYFRYCPFWTPFDQRNLSGYMKRSERNIIKRCKGECGITRGRFLPLTWPISTLNFNVSS